MWAQYERLDWGTISEYRKFTSEPSSPQTRQPVLIKIDLIDFTLPLVVFLFHFTKTSYSIRFSCTCTILVNFYYIINFTGQQKSAINLTCHWLTTFHVCFQASMSIWISTMSFWWRCSGTFWYGCHGAAISLHLFNRMVEASSQRTFKMKPELEGVKARGNDVLAKGSLGEFLCCFFPFVLSIFNVSSIY